jgi:hypothetical protein
MQYGLGSLLLAAGLVLSFDAASCVRQVQQIGHGRGTG